MRYILLLIFLSCNMRIVNPTYLPEVYQKSTYSTQRLPKQDCVVLRDVNGTLMISWDEVYGPCPRMYIPTSNLRKTHSEQNRIDPLFYMPKSNFRSNNLVRPKPTIKDR